MATALMMVLIGMALYSWPMAILLRLGFIDVTPGQQGIVATLLMFTTLVVWILS